MSALPKGMTCEIVWVIHPRDLRPDANLVINNPGFIYASRNGARLARTTQPSWIGYKVSRVLVICVEKK